MWIVDLKKKIAKSVSDRGFTLIEIMVAVLLLMFAMAGIVPLFLGGLSQASTVRYKSIATNIARERMEEIRQLDYREIADADYLAERFGTEATQRDLTFTISYDVESSAYDEGTLKKVTVNVDWEAPPTVSAASITTLIHQQFLGPRGALLEVSPTSVDPLGTPFGVIASTTKARYHIAQADWNLVYDNLDQDDMAAKDVYMRLVLFDDAGESIPLGPEANEYKIDNTYLRYSIDAEGKVDDVWFEYNFDAWSIPDGYWEMRAVAYNEWGEPGNVWRLRLRIEKGAPAAPSAFTALVQEDNQSVLLTWTGGTERDRAYYVLQRSKWDGEAWSDWSTIADQLGPNVVTFTDQGSVGAEQDPWGTLEVVNSYQYRIWAVDICQPGNAGLPAVAEATIPPSEYTTTTVPPPPDSTTTTSTTSTTLATSFTAEIVNESNKSYNLNVRDAGGTLVFTGSVSKNNSRVLDGLSAGNYQITASSPGRTTIVQSFSLPAQAGQVVLTIF